MARRKADADTDQEPARTRKTKVVAKGDTPVEVTAEVAPEHKPQHGGEPAHESRKAPRAMRTAKYVGPSGSVTLSDGRGPFQQGERFPLTAQVQRRMTGLGHVFSDVIEEDDTFQMEPLPDEAPAEKQIARRYAGPSGSLTFGPNQERGPYKPGDVVHLTPSEQTMLEGFGHVFLTGEEFHKIEDAGLALPEDFPAPLSTPPVAETDPSPAPAEGVERT
jgi:hypothetical protein